MNNSDFLRYNNCYAQIVEKYSSLLRKMSMLHPRVIDIHGSEINKLVKNADKLLAELDGINAKAEKLFELRKLIYQIEYIINFKVIKSYNNLLDKVLAETKTNILQNITIATQEPASTPEEEPDNIIKEPKEIWDSVCEYLKSKLNVHTYNVWVKPVRYHSCDEKLIRILVQNSYYKNWLEEHCLTIINEHLSRNNVDYEVRFITG